MLANCRTYESEPIQLYTLEDAERIINRRNRIAYNKKKRLAIYYLKQKLCGLVMLGIGISCPVLLDGDATFSLIAVPMELGYWLLRKELWILGCKTTIKSSFEDEFWQYL